MRKSVHNEIPANLTAMYASSDEDTAAVAANLTAVYACSDKDTAAVSEARGRAFSASTVAVLRLSFPSEGNGARGMVGTGRDHSSLISEAAHETNLTDDQVKVCNCRHIKKFGPKTIIPVQSENK